MAIGIGQADAAIGFSRAAYTQALVNSARYHVAQGYRVLLDYLGRPWGTVTTWMATTGKSQASG